MWDLVILASAVLGIALFLARRRWNRTALLAARLSDTRAIGTVAETLKIGDSATIDVVEEALTGLRPQLRASDAGLLNAHQRACLHRALRRQNVELVLAILKAPEQLGDASAIPHVERLAAEKGRTRRDARIRDAAIACLPALRANVAAAEAAGSLLRAAGTGTEPAGELVRPAESRQTPDETLVRAVSE